MDTEMGESPFPPRLYLPPNTRFVRVSVAVQTFATADAAQSGKNPLGTVVLHSVKTISEDKVRNGIVSDDLKDAVDETADGVMRGADDLWRK